MKCHSVMALRLLFLLLPLRPAFFRWFRSIWSKNYGVIKEYFCGLVKYDTLLFWGKMLFTFAEPPTYSWHNLLAIFPTISASWYWILALPIFTEDYCFRNFTKHSKGSESFADRYLDYITCTYVCFRSRTSFKSILIRKMTFSCRINLFAIFLHLEVFDKS